MQMTNYQDTSREAWRTFIPFSRQLDTQIMEALQGSASGMTCEEIERTTGRKHQAVSANLSRLKDAGLVMASGRYGKTAANRKAIIWVVANDLTNARGF